MVKAGKFGVKIVLCYARNSPFDVPPYAFGQVAAPLLFHPFCTVFLKPREAGANSLSLLRPLFRFCLAQIVIEMFFSSHTNCDKPALMSAHALCQIPELALCILYIYLDTEAYLVCV